MDLGEAFFQALVTVIIGVSVYALGEVTVKFFIEPVNQLSETIGEVLDTLVYYANIYTNPFRAGEPTEMTDARGDAAKSLRQKATLLMSKATRVRWYSFASFFEIIPTKQRVEDAHREMIFLSNSCFTCDPVETFKTSERIRILLASTKPAEDVHTAARTRNAT